MADEVVLGLIGCGGMMGAHVNGYKALWNDSPCGGDGSASVTPNPAAGASPALECGGTTPPSLRGDPRHRYPVLSVGNASTAGRHTDRRTGALISAEHAAIRTTESQIAGGTSGTRGTGGTDGTWTRSTRRAVTAGLPIRRAARIMCADSEEGIP